MLHGLLWKNLHEAQNEELKEEEVTPEGTEKAEQWEMILGS